MTAFGIRGTFLDFIDDPWRHVGRESESARFHADGLLVVEDGRITDFGAYDATAARRAGLDVTTIGDRVIAPGFIDGHIHCPQTRVLGAFGEHLLPWLEKWVFPEDDLVGNFAPGKEADFVVLDCNGGPPALAWRQSLIAEHGQPRTLEQAADLLFGVMTVGDDRAIDQTWAMGRQVYLRHGSNWRHFSVRHLGRRPVRRGLICRAPAS